MGGLCTVASHLFGGLEAIQRHTFGPSPFISVFGPSSNELVVLSGRRARILGEANLVIKGLSGGSFLVDATISTLARGVGGAGAGRGVGRLHLLPSELRQTGFLVMFDPSRGIGKKLVSLLDRLKLILGLVSLRLVLDLIGVAFQDTLSMGGLDFGDCSVLLDTEHSIGVEIGGERHVGRLTQDN